MPTMQKALTVILGPEPAAVPAALALDTLPSGPAMGTWFKRIDI